MQYAKLQIFCFLLVVFLNITYIKATLNKKISCNKFYDALMAIAPIAIFFDGLTAITVNKLEQIAHEWNLVFHLLFFISMDLVIYFLYLYMIDKTIGMSKKKSKLFLLSLPTIISIFIICLTIKDLKFYEGNYTNYSMGISVITCYTSLLIHYGIIFALMILKYKHLAKRKVNTILISLIFSFSLLIVQAINKEALISAFFPTISLIGMYISLEDPFIRRLEMYNQEMVSDFSTLIESRDNSTGGHVKRTKYYVSIIVNSMKKDAKYKNIMTYDYCKNIIDASPMHDIGKIATPDSVLQKNGKLTKEEYEIIKKHTIEGSRIIKETFSNIDDQDFLNVAYDCARYHHEKYNGNGYPEGLKEEKIPLHARIMAIADVFDAISSKRCYRDALPLDECFKIIQDGKNSDFDPDLVDLFLAKKDDIYKFCIENRK